MIIKNICNLQPCAFALSKIRMQLRIFHHSLEFASPCSRFSLIHTCVSSVRLNVFRSDRNILLLSAVIQCAGITSGLVRFGDLSFPLIAVFLNAAVRSRAMKTQRACLSSAVTAPVRFCRVVRPLFLYA